VDLPWRSSVEQRSQADRLATRIAERAGIGELAVAGGNWNSYGRADPLTPATLDSAPLHLRPPGCGIHPRTKPWPHTYLAAEECGHQLIQGNAVSRRAERFR
jgi:hypothetical protein